MKACINCGRARNYSEAHCPVCLSEAANPNNSFFILADLYSFKQALKYILPILVFGALLNIFYQTIIPWDKAKDILEDQSAIIIPLEFSYSKTRDIESNTLKSQQSRSYLLVGENFRSEYLTISVDLNGHRNTKIVQGGLVNFLVFYSMMIVLMILVWKK